MEYALIQAGRVENVIVADQTFIDLIADEWDHIEPLDTQGEQAQGVGIGWRFEDGEFIAPSGPAEIPQDRKITVRAFRARFALAEQVAIEMASLDDPSGTPDERMNQAALRVYLTNLNVARFVDLDDADVIAGVDQLVAVGLLSEARAEEILLTEVQPQERP